MLVLAAMAVTKNDNLHWTNLCNSRRPLTLRTLPLAFDRLMNRPLLPQRILPPHILVPLLLLLGDPRVFAGRIPNPRRTAGLGWPANTIAPSVIGVYDMARRVQKNM